MAMAGIVIAMLSAVLRLCMSWIENLLFHPESPNGNWQIGSDANRVLRRMQMILLACCEYMRQIRTGKAKKAAPYILAERHQPQGDGGCGFRSIISASAKHEQRQ